MIDINCIAHICNSPWALWGLPVFSSSGSWLKLKFVITDLSLPCRFLLHSSEYISGKHVRIHTWENSCTSRSPDRSTKAIFRIMELQRQAVVYFLRRENKIEILYHIAIGKTDNLSCGYLACLYTHSQLNAIDAYRVIITEHQSELSRALVNEQVSYLMMCQCY